MSSAPWTVKHRPKKIAEIAGNRAAIEALIGWLKSWAKGPPEHRAVLLHGPPGVGKTVSAEAAANDLRLDLIEVNASDKRNRESLERIVGNASSIGQLLPQSRAILVDEIDGVNPTEDRGAVESIIRIIQNSSVPIILTANDAWDRRLAPLRDVVEMIQFKRLGVREIGPYLKRILDKEGLETDDEVLRTVIDKNRGDMRGIMNDLQTLFSSKRRLTFDDVSWLAYRDRKENIFAALGMLFNAKDCWTAKRAADTSDVDYETLFEWVYENAPRQLSDPEDLARAFEALARADLYFARIQRKQAWELLSYYFDMLTAGVATSRMKTKSGWVPNRFPERIRGMARTRSYRMTRDALAKAVAGKCHISSRRAVTHYLPYLNFMFEQSEPMASRLAAWLDLDQDSIEFLTGDERYAKKIAKAAAR